MLNLNNIRTVLSSLDVGFVQPLTAAGEGLVDSENTIKCRKGAGKMCFAFLK